MSEISELAEAYRRQIELPWTRSLSPAERVWIAVYQPRNERRLRAQLEQFRLHTLNAGHKWQVVDITDSFGRWIQHHTYREAFFASPDELTAAILEEYEEAVVDDVCSALQSPSVDENTIVALIGIGTLYPFVRASGVVKAVDDGIRGRLLVMYPGEVDLPTNTYRLLGAREGTNYRAIPIIAAKEHP